MKYDFTFDIEWGPKASMITFPSGKKVELYNEYLAIYFKMSPPPPAYVPEVGDIVQVFDERYACVEQIDTEYGAVQVSFIRGGDRYAYDPSDLVKVGRRDV